MAPKKKAGPPRARLSRLGFLNCCEARGLRHAWGLLFRAAGPGEVPALGGANRIRPFLTAVAGQCRQIARPAPSQNRPGAFGADRDIFDARGQVLEKFLRRMTVLSKRRRLDSARSAPSAPEGQ